MTPSPKVRYREHFSVVHLLLITYKDQLEPQTVMCVCEACSLSVRHALKARDKEEPYQLRWLKSKRKCCVPSCSSADIKAERHDFSWEVIGDSIGIDPLPAWAWSVYYT